MVRLPTRKLCCVVILFKQPYENAIETLYERLWPGAGAFRRALPDGWLLDRARAAIVPRIGVCVVNERRGQRKDNHRALRPGAIQWPSGRGASGLDWAFGPLGCQAP